MSIKPGVSLLLMIIQISCLSAQDSNEFIYTSFDSLTGNIKKHDIISGYRTVTNSRGIILEESTRSNHLRHSASCNHVRDQSIIRRYSNGSLKEIGELKGGRKIGQWIYFYENGHPRLIENFEKPYPEEFDYQLEKLHRSNSPLRKGSFIEYFENGPPKTKRSYAIIEQFSKTRWDYQFDADTYE